MCMPIYTMHVVLTDADGQAGHSYCRSCGVGKRVESSHDLQLSFETKQNDLEVRKIWQ